MKIVLSGVETNNKGAELMLYAILQEIERKYPEATVYVELGSISQGLEYIDTPLKLRQKPIAYARKWCARLHMFGIARRLHVNPIVFEDIYAVPRTDFFLNDSGFYYSDQWNLSDAMIEKRRRLLRGHHRQGTKIVLLPQAFGPIHLPNTMRGIKDLNQYAHVVMARERTSYNYLINTGLIDEAKIQLYPDFTSLVHGVMPKSYDHLRNGVCIIPNCRMLDKGNLTYHAYQSFIDAIIKECTKNGFTPYLLNHEGKDDGVLARRMAADASQRREVVDGLNALQVKGIISSSYLVITSRFHGVASALNSSVPCLATSWSHKYQELFTDYQQPECVLDVMDISHRLDVVGEYLDKERNRKTRAQLNEIVPTMQEKSREMWQFIWNL